MAGLVLHGPGGVGKSALAAEIVARAGQLELGRVIVSFRGEVSADTFLARLASALRRHPVAASRGGARALVSAGRTDLSWAHRLDLFRDHVLGQVPVLIVLDDFDDNLSAKAAPASAAPGKAVRANAVPARATLAKAVLAKAVLATVPAKAARPAVEDPALAGLLASVVSAPGLARLLITCRARFTLPGTTGAALGFRCVGPLAPSAAAGLAASLPGLSLLDEQDIDRAWWLTGGYPRVLEYLDALLATGHADFAEVAERLAAAIRASTGQAIPRANRGAQAGGSPATDPPIRRAPAPGSLAPSSPTPGSGAPGSLAAAEKAALVAGDMLLGELCARLSPDARDLLTGASVYREPVGSHVLLLPAGRARQAAGLTGLVAECAAAGLLTADYSGELPSVFVHRWTASQLHERLVREQRGAEVADAHRRAAEYWRWRISSWPHDRHALHEASYHLLRAGEHDDYPGTRNSARRRLVLLGSAAMAVAIAAGTAAAAGVFTAPAHAPGVATAPGAATVPEAPAPRGALAGSPGARSAAVRGQAAAWIARQASADAIVACDPAMCADLQAHGIPAGNLLVLRPSSGDPLGSDLVVATPAVRSQFGGRLASVYAPVVIASFGSGGLRIDVRAVAPDGAAAYHAALAADLAARRGAGRELLRNSRISVSPAARADLAAGRVDARLLLTLAAVVSIEPVRITAFTDSGPGAASGVPLRGAGLTGPAPAGTGSGTGTGAGTGAGPEAALRQILVFLRAQRPPYRPARAVLGRGPGGAPLLSVRFGAPSPAGLIQSRSSRPPGPG